VDEAESGWRTSRGVQKYRFLGVLLDDVLALDAGSIASGLTFEEQEKVATIFLSHYHFDHTKDVPVIAYNTLFSTTINIYCLPVVKDVMLTHINPHYEDEIRAELAPLIEELGGLLEVSYEDMEGTVKPGLILHKCSFQPTFYA
jgi:ribonuclease BN (tRNA processing enzyme)